MGLPIFYKHSTWVFKASSWSYFYDTFISYYVNTLLRGQPCNDMFINIGSSLDIYASYILSILYKLIPFLKISFGYLSPFQYSSVVGVSSFINKQLFTDMNDSDILLSDNISFSSEFPLIKTRLRRYLQSDIHAYSVGLSNDTLFNRISLLYERYIRLCRGKLFDSNVFVTKRRLVVCSQRNLVEPLSAISKRKVLNLSISYIKLASNTLSNIQTSYIGEVGNYINLKDRLSFFYGIDSPISLDLSKYRDKYFYVFQGTHKHIDHFFCRYTCNNQHIWFLPTSSQFEEDAPYFNILGILQWTKKVLDNYNFSQSNSSILMHILLALYDNGILNNLSAHTLSNTNFSNAFLDKVPALLSSNSIEQSYYKYKTSATTNTLRAYSASAPLFVHYSSIMNQVKKSRKRYYDRFNVFI